LPEYQDALSEFRAVWLFAMFDLPVDSKEKRRAYTRFRKELLRNGFTMLQYSVYCRYCPSEDASVVYKKHVKRVLPDEGQVRLALLTDRQFGKMEVFFGKNREPVEDPPSQMMLF
jgi:CRISPR-associated protein Cas2